MLAAATAVTELRSDSQRSTASLLEIQNLSVAFRTKARVIPVVRGVSLDIRERETVGLVGESGSGKSVTALSILRLLPPAAVSSAEMMRFDAVDLGLADRRLLRRIRGAEIGIVFQDPMTSLNPVLTVGHQISETLRVHLGMDKGTAAARAVELLEMVEIPGARKRFSEYPHQFSGGMRQRAMIAMALSCGPKLLIADEATTALDVTIQAQILDLLRRLQRDLGMAMLLITHDFGVVAGIADTINVMYAGRIVETGPVDLVFSDPRHPYTRGLLKSLPELGVSKSSRLWSIDGIPPDSGDLVSGCPFRPRCLDAVARCGETEPPLLEVAPVQLAACWVAAGQIEPENEGGS